MVPLKNFKTKGIGKAYINIAKRMAQKDAQGIILGCTEIGMLIKQRDVQVELFDTTAIHAAKAVQMALD